MCSEKAPALSRILTWILFLCAKVPQSRILQLPVGLQAPQGWAWVFLSRAASHLSRRAGPQQQRGLGLPVIAALFGREAGFLKTQSEIFLNHRYCFKDGGYSAWALECRQTP